MVNCPKCQTLFDPKTKWGFKKFCSRSCGNSRIRTDEFKQQAREFALKNPRGWAVNPSNINGAQKNREKWNLLRKIITCKECHKEFEVPYSQRSRKYCSVGCSNKNKYHIHSNRKKSCTYKGQKMDSGAELLFAQHCDKHGLKWHKNTTKFFTFTDSKGKVSKYYPDFYLEEYNIWVEIKGKRYIRQDDDLRRHSVGNIFLIISNQFESDFKNFINHIGLD